MTDRPAPLSDDAHAAPAHAAASDGTASGHAPADTDPDDEAVRAEPAASPGLATTAPARPIEIELKYRPRTLAAGERLLLADEIGGFRAVAPPRTVVFDDRYVDTRDGALARAGFAARIRRSPKRTIVSVKSTRREPDATGAHRRQELEGPADAVAPARDWPHSDARSLMLELAGDQPLEELVTIRQQRRRRHLSDGDTTFELSLDEVAVIAGGTTVEQWLELEIELVRGDEERLMGVATDLARDPELEAGQMSKLEAALAVLAALKAAGREAPANEVAGREAPAKPPRPPKLAVPKTPGVTGDDTVAEAGRKTLRFHFARMLAREAGTRDGSDLEELHAMRVATRRMRAAWRIFGSGFRADRTRKLRRRLRDIARGLGDVRDLDVQLETLDAYRGQMSSAEHRALQPLADSWHRSRDDAREALVRELDSDGYVRFVEEFRVFVQTEGAAAVGVSPTEPHHVRDTAPSRIWAAYEQVRAYEPVLRWADVETLHELRIAAKWLRYSLEFVREPLGPDVDVLVPRVTALQDHLGWLHDADVAAGRARAFLVEHAGALSTAESAAIGRYLVSRERELERLRRTVGPAWRGVAGLAFRRRLGRAVAEL